MSVISVKQLLESGINFGHQTKKWNPNMKEYIYTERNGIHIIDVEKTVKYIESAYKFTKEQAEQGKTFLFVGTKKQAEETIKEEAERCGMFYINSRWLGGTLTNFKTIRSRVDRLKSIDKMEAMGDFELLPKKEVIQLKLEREKLTKYFGGVKEMNKLPDVLFVIDTNKEHIAIKEAKKLNIPIIALVDTNSDPRDIDVIIPGNDDAIRAVKLVSKLIADAIIEANEGESAEETNTTEESNESNMNETDGGESKEKEEIVETNDVKPKVEKTNVEVVETKKAKETKAKDADAKEVKSETKPKATKTKEDKEVKPEPKPKATKTKEDKEVKSEPKPKTTKTKESKEDKSEDKKEEKE